MGDMLDGMRAGNRSFDDFNGSGGQVVFRAKGNDGSAGVEHIANQAEKQRRA